MSTSATGRQKSLVPLPSLTLQISTLQELSAALFQQFVSDWETAQSLATSLLITLLEERFSSMAPTYSRDTSKIQHAPKKPSQKMAGYAQVMSEWSCPMALLKLLIVQRIYLSFLRESILLPKNLRIFTLKSQKLLKSSSMETPWRTTSSQLLYLSLLLWSNLLTRKALPSRRLLLDHFTRKWSLRKWMLRQRSTVSTPLRKLGISI